MATTQARGSRVWLCALLLGVLASVASAQPPQLLTTRLPTPVNGDGASGDNFGVALAVVGDWAIVGAYGDTVVATGATFGVAQGAAYVFEHSAGQWLQRQKISPEPVGEDGDNFGVAVAAFDDALAIGAPRRNSNDVFEAGAVFVYFRAASGYALRQVVEPPVPASEQRFGAAVALWQDHLAVGAPQSGAGRVDLYRRAVGGGYVYQRSLFAPDANGAAARFGAALAIADGELLIGAPNADGSGAVYRNSLLTVGSAVQRLPLTATPAAELGTALAIAGGVALAGAPGAGIGEARVMQFGPSGWQQTAVLSSANGVAGDRFGSAVALDAERAVIAAIAATQGDGAVYVYDRSAGNFSARATLSLAHANLSNRFGAAVATAPGGVLVGADLERVGPNPGQGAVHWYQPISGGMLETAILDNGDGAMFDRYGTAVAVDGDIAMIGSYLEDTVDGADAGSVHWYQRQDQSWVYGGALHAPDASIEDRFGIAVDVDGDYAAVGAYWDVIGDNVDQGSAYVFRRQGAAWVFDAKLTAADGRARDLFGFSLSLEGDHLLVGARGALNDGGTAYVFIRSGSGWAQEARLDLPQPAGISYFGANVALSDSRALIGAPGATILPGPLAAGAAYVYEHHGGGWNFVATLQAPEPSEGAGFGYSVAADAQRLLVGSLQSGFASQGAGFVYRAVDRVLDGRLLAGAAQPGEVLGISVALSGTTAVLGGSGFDLGNLANAGNARVFERRANGWIEAQQWFAADADYGDGFGRAVAVDGDTVLVGAPGKGIDNPLEGMAYIGSSDDVFSDDFE